MGLYQSAFLEHRLDKASFKAEEPKLRAAAAGGAAGARGARDFPVLILVTGMDGAGKGGVIQRLYEWLDPRHLRTNGYGAPDEAERARPWMWRYWRDLPPKGEIGVVFGSWYNDPLYRSPPVPRPGRLCARARCDRPLRAMLATEGALILKFMLVVSDKEQKKRLKEIAKAAAAGGTCWRNSPRCAAAAGRRSGAQPGAGGDDHRGTDRPHAPWVVLASDDPRYRDLNFGRAILEALRGRLLEPAGPAARGARPRSPISTAGRC